LGLYLAEDSTVLPVDPVSMGWLKGLVLFLLVAMMLAKARVGGA